MACITGGLSLCLMAGEPDRDPFRAADAPLFADKTLRAVSIGSGFFVDAGGHLLTNRHVVENCAGLSVEPVAGRPVIGRLVAIDEHEDLALLQTDLADRQPLRFRAWLALESQPVVIIGYPSQGLPRLTPFMVEGKLTGPRENNDYMLEGDIRPGNSGGPVLDREGLVVGIIYGKLDTVRVYALTGRHQDKIGFAIGTPAIASFLQSAGIDPLRAASGDAAEPAVLFDAAKPSLARVLCWRRPGA